MAELKDHVKQFEKAVEALRKADKASGSEAERLALIEAARAALGTVDLSATQQFLSDAEGEMRRRVQEQLSQRRQGLDTKARELGLVHRRLSDVDKVGAFTLKYSNRKVRIFVGDEELTSFEEVDGTKVVERVVEETVRLDAMLLPRDRFFRVLKTAIAAAKVNGKVSEGRIKVRDLFPYVAATRQLASDSFRKKPSAKSFIDYSLAMLAYELHRFGASDQGWTCGTERLANQGPAMATQHEALVLPDASGNPVQVLWLWVA